MSVLRINDNNMSYRTKRVRVDEYANVGSINFVMKSNWIKLMFCICGHYEGEGHNIKKIITKDSVLFK
jgi:hypothetical protein